MIRLFSLRHSIAKGPHWVCERLIIDEQYANQWLRIFQEDEPSVRFILARKEPKKVPQD